MKKFLFFVLLAFAVLLSSCGPTTPEDSFQEYFAGTWLVGEHELRYMERYQGLEGSFAGGIFFVSGNLSAEPALTFSWEPKPGNVVITSLPLSAFYFVIDETKEIPTAEFVFYYSDGDSGYSSSARDEVISWVLSENPNTIISRNKFGGLNQVVVRISSETLENEIYLPH